MKITSIVFKIITKHGFNNLEPLDYMEIIFKSAKSNVKIDFELLKTCLSVNLKQTKMILKITLKHAHSPAG